MRSSEERAPGPDRTPRAEEVLAAWREMRFGLFIHWGLYALPAGEWEGRRVPGLGEWIMTNAPIPREAYMDLARRFNPVKFEARAWVDLARRAGMKYLIVTAKHHDGFAIYRSHHPFSMTATPFPRDPLAELAEASREAGLRLGFYYSQFQDWTEPGGAGYEEGSRNGRGRPSPEAFKGYVDAKVKPQLRELLTRYGPVAILWFDTPGTMTVEESLDLRNFVKSIQPDCLVSGRIGNDLGDYGSMGDNIIPVGRVEGDWETPATLNDTWGFRRDDTNWKTADSLIRLLADLVSKGVNYLLNVGPTAAGEIPAPSVELLQNIGDWMAVYGEAVYGTLAGPFSYEIPGLRMTSKGNSLFLFLMENQTGSVRIHGLKSRIRGIVPLDRPARTIPFSQTSDHGIDRIAINVPANESPWPVRVLRLDLDGPPEVDDTLLQQPDGTVTLPAFLADWRNAEGIRLEHNGMVRDWRKTGPSLVWTYRVGEPGRFRVEICAHHCGDPGTFSRGMRMRVDNGATSIESELTPSGLLNGPRNKYCPEVVCTVGTIHVAEPGTHTLGLKRTSDGANPAMITQVRLMPAP